MYNTKCQTFGNIRQHQSVVHCLANRTQRVSPSGESICEFRDVTQQPFQAVVTS